MTYKNHPSSTLSLILFFSTILFASNAAASHLSPFCVTAIDKSFCSRVVQGAETWKAAIRKAIETTSRHASRTKPLVDDLLTKLPSTLSPAAKYSICETCKESYDSLIDQLNESMEAVEKGDTTGKLNFMLSAASADLGDCSRALRDFKVPTKIGLFKSNEVTAKLIGTCLAVENTRPKNP